MLIGAWDQDGKGEQIWDHASHFIPGFIKNNQTADIACDSYHKYKEDVRLLKELGVDHYRFSISWARILPEGKKCIHCFLYGHYLFKFFNLWFVNRCELFCNKFQNQKPHNKEATYYIKADSTPFNFTNS